MVMEKLGAQEDVVVAQLSHALFLASQLSSKRLCVLGNSCRVLLVSVAVTCVCIVGLTMLL